MVAGASSFGPMSPDADPGSGTKPTFKSNGVGILQVEQGATLLLQWVCESYDQFGNPLGPCPSGTTTYWATGSVPGAFQAGFSPSVTDGGSTTTEWFTAQTTAQPGTYGVYACYAMSYEGQSVGNGCVAFPIEVIAATTNPLPTPSPGLHLSVKLQISTAGVSGGPIPGQGHLYIELYANGAPFTSLQAGCRGNPIQCASGIGSKLVAAKFSQYPLKQPGVDISSAVSQSGLIVRYNMYQYYQSIGDEPNYSATSMNSNTWADGLLLSAGASPSQISAWVTELKAASGLSPTAFENGAELIPCFDPGGPVHIAVTRAASAAYCDGTERPLNAGRPAKP